MLHKKAVIGFCLSLFFAGFLHASPKVVYKEARPQKELAGEDKKREYTYDPRGKVDPFASFVVKEEEKAGTGYARVTGGESGDLAEAERLLSEMVEPKTELQRINLADLTLRAVIKSKGKIRAMVTDPEGKGFVLEQGTPIGTSGGVVDRIAWEQQDTSLGRQTLRKVVIKEPFINQKKELDYRYVEMEMPHAVTD